MRGRHGGSPVPPAAGFPQERTAPNMPTHPTLPTRQKGTLSRGNSGPPSQKATPSESRCQRAFGRRQPDAISRTTRCLSPPPPPPRKRGKGGLQGGGGAGARCPPPPPLSPGGPLQGPPSQPSPLRREAGRAAWRPQPGTWSAGSGWDSEPSEPPPTATSAGMPPLLHPSGLSRPPLSGLVCGAPRKGRGWPRFQPLSGTALERLSFHHPGGPNPAWAL